MDSTPDSTSSTATPPSRWALATLGDAMALGELAASYWYCVYVWWRRSGLDGEAGGTATVASFTRWMTAQLPSVEDGGAGLMREWLPARLAELAAEGWELEGEAVIAIEPEWAEGHYADEPEGDPDAIFHRRWTLTVLEFTMQALRAEYAARGLEALFGEVAPFVGFEGADEAHYAAAADRAGMTVGAIRKAVFDFRTHHRDVLRSIVADTVADPADIDSEITALLCACDLPSGPERAPAPLPTAIRTFRPEELLARAMNTVQMTSGGGGHKWTPPSDAEVARLFPQYEMLGIIGHGGMGAVYRARQVALDREVAIKLLPLEVSADQAFADRFVREARAMAKLSHPNIISVFDFGTTAEGHLFFVMEYVEGANVSQIIRGPGIEPEQALVITGQVCTALAYAHGRGVIHRDIKPANVMVGTDGMAKVADFGLARMSGADPEQYGQTMTGTVMGTPEYMSPEQKRGMAVDHRADIYSMGVMLYEMLCKEPPQGTFEPPSQRAGCDARIDQIVLKAMHRTPEGRYQSSVEMRTDVDAARTPFPASPQRRLPGARMNPGANHPHYIPPPKKSPAGLISALVVAGLLVGGAIYFLNGNKKPATKPQAKTAPPPPRLSTPAPELFGPALPPGFKAPEVMPVVGPVKENPPVPQVPPLAGPKDLLADVDVARDARIGDWQMTPEGLMTNANPAGAQVLGFNYAPPEEYDFEIEFTIKGGVREIGQVLALAANSILWKMGFGTGEQPTFFSFGDLLDGRPASNSSRTDAVVRLPRLKLNQRYRTVVEVRRDSLRALLDGEEVLRWSGDLTRLAADEKFLLKDRRELGVMAWVSTVLFHKAVVRPPGITTLPPPPPTKPHEAPNVAASPAASALVAASNDPRLVKLETAFKARFDSDAQKPYLASIAALNQSYLVNGLARARPAAQAKGSLDEVTALDAEKDAIGKGAGVPPSDEPGTPGSLKALRVQYRAVMARYTAERARVGGQLYDIYLAALDGYVVELTRANKIDEAKKVKTLREEVAGKKAELAQPGVTEPFRTGTAPAIPAPAAGAPLREVAKWLLAIGGRVSIAKGTLQAEVLAERELPAGRFEIIGLTLDQRQLKAAPPVEADFQVLRELKTLRTIWTYWPGLGDAAFEFLTDNVELTSVDITTGELTDGVLPHLAAARKLTEITLTSSPRFTGRGLEKMRWLPVLTKADFHGCGLGDEGLKELLAARRLQSLNLQGTKVTPAGVEAFKKAVPKCVVSE